MKHQGAHKRLSCELCHAPVSEHAKDGNKFADMPVKRGEEQRELCLKCHQKVIGRPAKFPMVVALEHLKEQKVRSTHSCNRCHTVHAPLETMKHIEHIKELRKLRKGAGDE